LREEVNQFSFEAQGRLRLRVSGARSMYAHVGLGAGLYRVDVAWPESTELAKVGGLFEVGCEWVMGGRIISLAVQLDGMPDIPQVGLQLGIGAGL